MKDREGAQGRVAVRVVAAWLAVTAVAVACSSARTKDEYRRETDVYVAVLRAAIGGAPVGGGEPLVFVSPMVGGSPFPLEVQAGVIALLSKEAQVKFVDRQAEAIDGSAKDQPVLNGGVLLSLATVPLSGGVFDLSAQRYRSASDRAALQFSVRSTAGTWVAQIAEQPSPPGG